MKIAKAAAASRMAASKMTAILETAPLAGLILIAFGGSCSNIFHFFGASGSTGVFQYGDTACPDLLCLVAFREILRDRRLNRERKYGWLSWPVIVVVIGIALTLALGYIGNDKAVLAKVASSWAGSLAGLLPGAVLLLGLSLFHRRDTGTEPASTRRDRRKATAGTGAAEAKEAVPVPAQRTAEPAASTAPAQAPAAVSGEESPQPWTDEDLVAEARYQWIKHAAIGVRLSQGRFEMALKQSPRGGAGRGRVIEALKTVRAEMDEGASGDLAVGQ